MGVGIDDYDGTTVTTTATIKRVHSYTFYTAIDNDKLENRCTDRPYADQREKRRPPSSARLGRMGSTRMRHISSTQLDRMTHD